MKPEIFITIEFQNFYWVIIKELKDCGGRLGVEWNFNLSILGLGVSIPIETLVLSLPLGYLFT